jgi:hypothetical protein
MDEWRRANQVRTFKTDSISPFEILIRNHSPFENLFEHLITTSHHSGSSAPEAAAAEAQGRRLDGPLFVVCLFL